METKDIVRRFSYKTWFKDLITSIENNNKETVQFNIWIENFYKFVSQ